MYLIVDFIVKLLLVVEKNIILVVYNRLFKMIYFIVIIEKSARLFKDNIQKLYRLQKSIILDKRPQSIVKLIKKLNEILETKTILLTMFYS